MKVFLPYFLLLMTVISLRGAACAVVSDPELNKLKRELILVSGKLKKAKKNLSQLNSIFFYIQSNINCILERRAGGERKALGVIYQGDLEITSEQEDDLRRKLNVYRNYIFVTRHNISLLLQNKKKLQDIISHSERLLA